MTQPSLRPPSSLQPRSKAAATFGSSAGPAKSTSSTPQFSTPTNQSRQTSPSRSPTNLDTSDKASASLIRRVLCSHSHASERRPVEELLPPLTSSNDVDLQLYAIIAIVVKDLVNSWYGKITPDQDFVEEVLRIVAHCTRALETRLRSLDLEKLILDELPAVIERHVVAYRMSHAPSTAQSLSTNPRQIYHDLNPHPALSPVPLAENDAIDEQEQNESKYRQLLVQGALAILLPTEDLENPCLRTLVADVIAEVILGNAIGDRACQGWFIWTSIIKLVEMVKTKIDPQKTGEAITIDTRGRLEKFGLLAGKEEKYETERHRRKQRSGSSSLSWRTLQFVYLAVISIRFVIVGFVAASSQPLRASTLTKTQMAHETSPIETESATTLLGPPPILRFRVFSLLSTLIDLPARSPWLYGSLVLLQHHLVEGFFTVAATNGRLDQFIHSSLMTYLAPSQLLPPALRLLRTTLFPNSSLPTTSSNIAPSPAQIQQTKRECAISILSLVPQPVQRQYFPPATYNGLALPETFELADSSIQETSTAEDDEDRSLQEERDAGPASHAAQEGAAINDIEHDLEVWSDPYLNKHVVYALLESVLVRVLPELSEQTVSELVKSRLGEETPPRNIDDPGQGEFAPDSGTTSAQASTVNTGGVGAAAAVGGSVRSDPVRRRGPRTMSGTTAGGVK